MAYGTALFNLQGYQMRVETLDASNDLSDKNNVCSFTQSVTGTLNVLLIGNNKSETEVLQRLYGDDVNIDSYIKTPYVPFTVEDLCLYDEIVMCGVDVSTLENGDAFVDSLDKVISVFGKTLINMGDGKLQNGSDNDAVNAYKDLLPVTYGNSEQDNKLYTIVIDCSRSMNFNFKFTYAKLVAQNLLNVLSDQDKVMIVGFAGDPKLVYTITSASNRGLLAKAITDLNVTQGTVLSAALEATYDLIKDLDYENKQVMLISDGLSYSLDGDAPSQIAAQMRADGMTSISSSGEWTQ